jgi:predicted Zn-dependent peptidase
MGASAREIERQIKETRERMDQNLTRLEGKAASSARRYGMVAGALAGAALLAGVALLLYRRTHPPTLRDRISDLSLDDLRDLVDRLKDAAPSVTVRVNEKGDEEPGTVESILRKVAPALVGTAGTALLQRIAVQPEDESSTPQAE